MIAPSSYSASTRIRASITYPEARKSTPGTGRTSTSANTSAKNNKIPDSYESGIFLYSTLNSTTTGSKPWALTVRIALPLK